VSETTPEQIRARMAQWRHMEAREAERLRAMTIDEKADAIDRMHASIDTLGLRESLHAEQGRGRAMRLELLRAMEARGLEGTE